MSNVGKTKYRTQDVQGTQITLFLEDIQAIVATQESAYLKLYGVDQSSEISLENADKIDALLSPSDPSELKPQTLSWGSQLAAELDWLEDINWLEDEVDGIYNGCVVRITNIFNPAYDSDSGSVIKVYVDSKSIYQGNLHTDDFAVLASHISSLVDTYLKEKNQ